ncbi:GMP synthase [Parasalinivibrio latis]|uniref:glutamine amidotransferase-related protein n=1 Tax=Parasalinivibrio latis TaxID=2952610 RepID=UPI0030E1DB8F
MHIGILLCDEMAPALQPDFCGYPDMFSDFFSMSPVPVKMRFYQAFKGELPDNVDECDAYVTSGGKYSVYEDLPWIRQLEDFVLTLYEKRKKFVGICFGHQLIARAMGGIVRKADSGWGIGVKPINLSAPLDWMIPFKPQINLLMSHQDQVTELTRNVQVLGGSDFCPFGMICVDNTLLGIQGHPEFTKDYARALMEMRRDRIPPSVIDAAEHTLSSHEDGTLVLNWICNFLLDTD